MTRRLLATALASTLGLATVVLPAQAQYYPDQGYNNYDQYAYPQQQPYYGGRYSPQQPYYGNGYPQQQPYYGNGYPQQQPYYGNGYPQQPYYGQGNYGALGNVLTSIFLGNGQAGAYNPAPYGGYNGYPNQQSSVGAALLTTLFSQIFSGR